MKETKSETTHRGMPPVVQDVVQALARGENQVPPPLIPVDLEGPVRIHPVREETDRGHVNMQ